MKFSHIADVHIGSWRDPNMKILSTQAFIKSIDESIKENVDFVLIAGDLFNTAIPGIDQIKIAIKKLKELKEKNIPVYYIAGSHDYSPSGKTMLDVIEEAGLGIDVTKGSVNEEGKLQLEFTTDSKTGAKITGIIGRRGMLEKNYYENLDTTSLEKEEGFKIFMFHTSIDELKPKDLEEMESNPISFLPKGFDYYAGGHVHIVADRRLPDRGYSQIVYPGPTFPANFSELEKLGSGGFYIYKNGEMIRKDLHIKEIISKNISFEDLTPEQASDKIQEEIEKLNVKNKIILLRISGSLNTGNASKIDMKKIINFLYEKDAYYVMKNTSKITSKEFTELKNNHGTSSEVENEIIKEHLNQITHNFKNEEQTIKELITTFSQEKNEGEKQTDYDERIKKDVDVVLEKEADKIK